MVNRAFFRQGDLVYLNFDPQAGHEQKGRRPALVVSVDLFNRVSNLTMVCPITHTNRNSPFHVKITGKGQIDGYVMCDQVRMLDLKSRDAAFVEAAPTAVTAEVVDIISGFLNG